MPRAPHNSPPFLLIRNRAGFPRVQARRILLPAFLNKPAPVCVFPSWRRTVPKRSLFLLLCVSLFSLSAFAEEWSKSYQVGDKPSLRVDTNDASVEISRGASHTVSARIIADGYSFDSSGVR